MRLFQVYQISLIIQIGENAMPHRNPPASARHHTPQQQIDLFTQAATIGDLPLWSELPRPTQAALSSLMSRLILDHANNRRIVVKGGRHDD
jgi:hypothetical protein